MADENKSEMHVATTKKHIWMLRARVKGRGMFEVRMVDVALFCRVKKGEDARLKAEVADFIRNKGPGCPIAWSKVGSG